MGTAGVLLAASSCAAETTAATGGGFDYTTIILLGVMVAAFYFLMIRPQQKRSKEQRKLLEDLKKGDRVITSGGMFGTIDGVEDETIIIKVESGATVRMLKNSVMVKRES